METSLSFKKPHSLLKRLLLIMICPRGCSGLQCVGRVARLKQVIDISYRLAPPSTGGVFILTGAKSSPT